MFQAIINHRGKLLSNPKIISLGVIEQHHSHSEDQSYCSNHEYSSSTKNSKKGKDKNDHQHELHNDKGDKNCYNLQISDTQIFDDLLDDVIGIIESRRSYIFQKFRHLDQLEDLERQVKSYLGKKIFKSLGLRPVIQINIAIA
jgi:hypothetical protein